MVGRYYGKIRTKKIGPLCVSLRRREKGEETQNK